MSSSPLIRHKIHSWRGHGLYHYPACRSDRLNQSLLIIYALVNRASILDIHPQRSFIKALNQEGLDVYLLEWHETSQPDPKACLSAYICQEIHQAVQSVQLETGQKVNIMGICQGGYFSVCYSALFPEYIRTLITVVTPFDFNVPDCRLLQILKYVDVALTVRQYGNVPGKFLDAALNQIQPFRGILKRWQASESVLETDLYQAVEAWREDCPDIPGKMCYEFVTECVRKNALLAGNLVLDNQVVSLKNLQAPILNIYAKNDHIWPLTSSRALGARLPREQYHEIGFEGGHIGVFISSQALKTIPLSIGAWLKNPISLSLR